MGISLYVLTFVFPQQLQPELNSYRVTGYIKIFVMSCITKSATICRYSGSFLISFCTANASNLITVTRHDPYFSFWDLHRKFNLLKSCTSDAFYYSCVCPLSFICELFKSECYFNRNTLNNLVPQVGPHYGHAAFGV